MASTATDAASAARIPVFDRHLREQRVDGALYFDFLPKYVTAPHILGG